MEDFAGLKVRFPGGQVYVAMYRALGATAIQMNWGEVYTAMQQGVIDGLECPVNIMVSSRLGEVGKYCTLDEHTYTNLFIAMSMPAWGRLNAQQRTILTESAREAGRFQRQRAVALDTESANQLRAGGVRVDSIDKSPLVRAMEPVYREQARNRALVERVQAMASGA
jgi:TRAP-type C4-dicarboxylate transport system substrate-binding protein